MISTHAKGSRWRHKVEEWFIDAGFATTVRGIGYSGDDLFASRQPPMMPLTLSVEAKNHRDITLSKFVDQASAQAYTYGDSTLPVCVIHRPGHSSVDSAYVVMP